jgi:hypothetical protein
LIITLVTASTTVRTGRRQWLPNVAATRSYWANF